MSGYAWSSIEDAAKFAFDVASVRIEGRNAPGLDRREESQRRIGVLLDLLEQYSPVLFATVWKHKERGGHISAIARSGSYMPDPYETPGEFVCPIQQTHASLLLDQATEIPECSQEWIRQWSQDDISTLPPDHAWNTPATIREASEKGPLKRQFALTLGDFCKRYRNDSACRGDRERVDFILNMYLDEAAVQALEAEENAPFSFTDGAKKDFLKALANKIASGICALIEVRKNRITDAMTSARMTPDAVTMAKAMRSAAKAVLPEYIKCKRVYLVMVRDSGELDQAMRNELSGTSSVHLSSADKQDLQALADHFFSEDLRGGRLHPDVALVSHTDIRKFCRGNGPVGTAKQMLIARLENREFPQLSQGYLVLLDRINDLAFEQTSGEVQIDDHFDWEDEEYLAHIASILDFVVALYSARERSLERAMVLGHEIKAPLRFIYESAHRQKELQEGLIKMPGRMQARELQDILDTSDYVETLADSLSSLGEQSHIPKANRYDPEPVRLEDIAREMARICLPLCKKFGLDHTRIILDKTYARVFMDERALRQVFLNLLTNAVKYRDPLKPDRFRVHVQFDALSVTDLATTTSIRTSNPDFHASLLDRNLQRGHLITVEDEGIGVVGPDPQRVFNPGYRQTSFITPGLFGAGLGLSVIRAILQDHGADAWVERQRGPTQFCLFLPSHLDNV